jgi:hypothetical protein
METTDILGEIGDVLGGSGTTTTTSTTKPSDAINPAIVIVGSAILLGIIGFIIFKVK